MSKASEGKSSPEPPDFLMHYIAPDLKDAQEDPEESWCPKEPSG